jgi:FkbM family methyltransferase
MIALVLLWVVTHLDMFQESHAFLFPTANHSFPTLQPFKSEKQAMHQVQNKLRHLLISPGMMADHIVRQCYDNVKLKGYGNSATVSFSPRNHVQPRHRRHSAGKCAKALTKVRELHAKGMYPIDLTEITESRRQIQELKPLFAKGISDFPNDVRQFIVSKPTTAAGLDKTCLSFPPLLRLSLTKRVENPFDMFVYEHSDMVSGALRLNGEFEAATGHFLLQVLDVLGTSRLFVDFGANLGWFSLLAASKGQKVLAIEASPCNFRVLKANVQVNNFSDHVSVKNVVLAQTVGSDICMAAVSGASGNRGNLKLDLHTQHDSTTTPCPSALLIPQTTLSVLLKDVTGVLGFMKVDCEGCEVSALAGARDLFSDPLRAPCALMIEWNPHMTANFEGSAVKANSLMIDVGQMLERARYQFLQYNKESRKYVETPAPRPPPPSLSSHKDVLDNAEYFATRDHPLCFSRGGAHWRDLMKKL